VIHRLTAAQLDDLTRRLRGVYVMPVNDGGGLLNGKDTFTRTFDDLPAIQGEAADALDAVRAERDEALRKRDQMQDYYNQAVAKLSRAKATLEAIHMFTQEQLSVVEWRER
jgi:hypothetical protein